MTDKLGLLAVNKGRDKLKGILIDTQVVEWEDIYHEQQVFAQAVNKKKNNFYAAMISLSKYNSVMGIPFTYAASFQGVSVKLYLFAGYTGKQLREAIKKLRGSKQIGKIVSIETLSVELVGSYRPQKVNIIDSPIWVNDNSVSYFDGNKFN